MNDLQVSSSWKDKTEEWSQVREDQGEKNHVQQGTVKDTHSCAPSMKKKKENNGKTRKKNLYFNNEQVPMLKLFSWYLYCGYTKYWLQGIRWIMQGNFLYGFCKSS